MPPVIEKQLVDVIVGPDVIDVLLVVEGRLVAIECASRRGGAPSSIRQVVGVPPVIEKQLVDVIVGPDVIDMLLVVEGRLVAIECGFPAPGAPQQHSSGRWGATRYRKTARGRDCRSRCN